MFYTTHYKCYSVALLSAFILLLSVNASNAQYGLSAVDDDTLSKTVMIYPPIETKDSEFIVSREHMYKSHLRLGDQLGRDFVITQISKNGTMEIFENDGDENEEYFSWQKNVMAPFHGSVTEINHPETTNKPGNMDRESKPGKVNIKNENGIVVMFVHVRDIAVEEGDNVEAGEVIAKIGNNGISRGPHVHIGAWKDETPLQIQVDLYADEKYKQE